MNEEPEDRVERIENSPELFSQVQIAKQFPRKLGAFSKKLTEMATFDQETAESCFYTLKRKAKGGETKKIVGPSIRLAEMAIQCYGNLRWGGRTVREEERQVVCQGVLHDLENNIAVTVEVSRRITTSSGARYGDDMIAVTSMAGVAICMRNAAFKGISSHLWKPAYESAMAKAVGDASTLTDRRQKMVGAFAKMGVGVEKLLAFVERSTLEEVTLEDLGDLIGAFNGIREGEQTVDETFGKAPASDISMPKSKAEAAAETGSPAGTTSGAAVNANPQPDDPPGEHAAPPAGDVIHGKTCTKYSHGDGKGFLHSEDEDGSYDVDGALYCGRCHAALEPGLDEAALSAEAHAREQAEAKQERRPAPTNGKIDRGKVWNALLRRAKADGKAVTTLLRELTAKTSMSELSDPEVEALKMKLVALVPGERLA